MLERTIALSGFKHEERALWRVGPDPTEFLGLDLFDIEALAQNGHLEFFPIFAGRKAHR